MAISSIIKTLQTENDVDKHEECFENALLWLENANVHDNAAVISSLMSCTGTGLKSKNVAIASKAAIVFGFILDHEQLEEIKLENEIPSVIQSFLRTSASEESVRSGFKGIYSCMEKKFMEDQNLVKLIHTSLFKDSSNCITETVKLETLVLILKLVNKEKDECRLLCLDLALLLTADHSKTVREKSLLVSETFLKQWPVKPSYIVPITSSLKQHIVPRLKNLFTNDSSTLCEVLTSQWPLFLQIVGISVKKSSTLINTLLNIVEQGFRSHSALNVKVAAFKAWDSLINCFAEDLNVLSSSRYIKLLMQPLTAVQSHEALSIARINTLWNLACKLRSKLPTLFTTVCLPILHCCLGNLDPARSNRKASENLTTPLKARHSGVGLSGSDDGFYAALQANGFRETPKKASKNQSLHLKGVEVLIHLLQPELKNDLHFSASKKITMQSPECPLLSSPATFAIHGQLFITAVREVICYLAKDISEDLILTLWQRLLHHLRLHLETNLKKKKRETELFSSFLQTIQSVYLSNQVHAKQLFSMISSFLELPREILSSTFYGGKLNGMHGIPALCLIKLLFSENLLGVEVSQFEKFTECASQLVSCGIENNMRLLTFCQDVLEILENYLNFVREPAKRHFSHNIVKMIWNQVGTYLYQHITKSHEVNQGDSLEHDFTAMYSFFMFPVKFACFECLATWTKVYKSFVWCANLVPTCKPNETSKFISSQILKITDERWEDSKISLVTDIVKCLVENFDFSHTELSKPSRTSHLATCNQSCENMRKYIKLEKHKDLEEICSLLYFLLNSSILSSETQLMEANLGIVSRVFENMKNNRDILSLLLDFATLLNDLKETFREEKKPLRAHIGTILASVCKGWKSEDDLKYLTKGLLHNDMVQFLLYGFQSQDRQIKQLFVTFWEKIIEKHEDNDNFLQNLPNSLADALLPIYTQLGWPCVWAKTTSVTLNTGLSQQENFTQSSLSEMNAYGAFASPLKKQTISLTSPRMSPLRSKPLSISSPIKSPSSVNRKLNSLPEMTTYVKCHSPFPKPSAPLTEHQKEKKSERGYIPTMYNNLDADSMDIESREVSDVEKPIDNNDKENSSQVSLTSRRGEEVISKDIIKTSQPIKKAMKQKTRSSNGKKKINLKIMSEIVENDDQDTLSTSVRRSGRIQSRNAKKSETIGEDIKKPIILLNDLSSKREKSNIEEESIISGSSGTEQDSLTGNATESLIEITDKSMEEQVSVSSEDVETNHAQHDISLDEESDNVIEGVTPLDDSYEYVAVLDISINPSSSRSLLSMKEEVKDSESSDDESEYEDVVMADMSACANNVTVSPNNMSNQKEDEEGVDDITKQAVNDNGLNQLVEDFGDAKPDNAKYSENSTLKQDEDEDDVDEVEYISSDEEGLEEVVSDQSAEETLDETEYDYVEVNDASVVARDGETSTVVIDSDDDFTDCEKDESIAKDAEGNLEETSEEFADARCSLSSVSALAESLSHKTNSVNVEEGKMDVSSGSGDLFDTSVEELDKSSVNKTINTTDDVSAQDESAETELNPSPTKDEMDHHADNNEITKEITDESKCKNKPDSLKENPSHAHKDDKSSVVKSKKINFKVPTLALERIQSESACPPLQSPSGKSILKRRMTIGPISTAMQSPFNRRRVSFAEPISKSVRVDKPVDDLSQSPRSSIGHRRKHSPSTVSRKLSLPREKNKPQNLPDIPASPLSLRSARVAEAIANIRAKDSTGPASPSRLLKNPIKVKDSSVPNDPGDDLLSILEDVSQPEFLKHCPHSKLTKIMSKLLSTSSLIFEQMTMKHDPTKND